MNRICSSTSETARPTVFFDAPTYLQIKQTKTLCPADQNAQINFKQNCAPQAGNGVNALKEPDYAKKRKVSVSNMENLPCEIFEHVVQLALDGGVAPDVLAIISKKLFYTVVKVICLQLNIVLKQAANCPETLVSLAQWLEAKKLTTWLNDILKLSGKVKFERYTGFTQKDVESLPGDLNRIGLSALRAGLVPWRENEEKLGNTDAQAQVISFVDVYQRDLHSLALDEANIHEVPEVIGFLQTLEHLDISSNELTDLPKALYCLKNLEYFSASGNQITTISADVKLLKKMKILNLSVNDMSELPRGIGDLGDLRWLHVGFNKIKNMTISAGQFKKLEDLFVTGNVLLESLPEELDNLPNLKHLMR